MTTAGWILAWVNFAVAALVFAAAMDGPQVNHLRWRRAHHFYLGLALFLWGAWIHNPYVMLISSLLMDDDAVQHAFQRWKHPDTRYSLVHIFVLPLLWRIPAYRRLSAWWDSLFA